MKDGFPRGEPIDFPMRLIRFLLLCLGVGAAVACCGAELVYVDADGVIRWTLDQREVALFGANYSLPSAWQEVIVPIAGLRIARGVKLPLGYPEHWNYWVAPAKGRGGSTDRPNLAAIEHLQLSLRPEPGGPKPKEAGADAWVDLASVALVFE